MGALGICPRCGEPMEGSYCGGCERKTRLRRPRVLVPPAEQIALHVPGTTAEEIAERLLETIS